MKLRNKKTGEIVEPFGITCINGRTFVQFDDGKGTFKFEAHSLAELNSEWEDMPEDPKTLWYMTAWGEVKEYSQAQFAVEQKQAIGNYFKTKEEAEKAVRKLKAWKRLKDNGYKFNGIGVEYDRYKIYLECDIMQKEHYTPTQDHKDLDLLFGGE